MLIEFKSIDIVLYISDQEKGTEFYRKLFNKEPDLNAPGMTEFILNDKCKLGLMPNRGIAKILSGNTPHPDTGIGIPRCELYLHVDNIEHEFENAISCGAKLISPVMSRDWGDRACYFADPDGHIIAFAEKIR